MMEDSEVLNNPETEVHASAPLPKDVEPTPTVLEQDTGTMYKNAVKPASPAPVVGENNHAETIANNTLSHADAEQTYDYTSQGKKNYDESVTTTTVQSTGANMTATWDSEYKMDQAYTAKEGEDYSWNKLAEEMAALDYAQESSQARYESMQTKQELDKQATDAFNKYFAAEYSARQTQDKMGWSGGQQTASDLQVAFLQAETAANMYTQDEMQRYGVETKLGIARMYAEANQRALALTYYQDAVDQAIKEAEQTGWYIPAEAGEMFKQQEIANKILADPNSTAEEKARAEQVNKNCQAYYDAKGFEHGYAYDEKTGKVVTEYYGIKCLQTLQYEETVRNNKVNEDLQRQANQIAKEANGIARQNLNLARAQYNLDVARQNRILGETAVKEGKPEIYAGGNATYQDSSGKTVKVPSGSTVYNYGGELYYKDASNWTATIKK